jgi:hypothetical protein
MKKKFLHKLFTIRYNRLVKKVRYLFSNAGQSHRRIKRAKKLHFKSEVLLFGKEHALVRKQRLEAK